MTLSPALPAARPTFVPSPYQRAIFEFLRDPANGSLVIEAVAGSGKTSTLVHCLDIIPASAATIFLAFNKRIAEELRSRAPKHVTCSTFHALSFKVLTARFGKGLRLDAKKPRIVLNRLLDEGLLARDEARTIDAGALQLLDLARQFGVGILRDDALPAWWELVRRFEVAPTQTIPDGVRLTPWLAAEHDRALADWDARGDVGGDAGCDDFTTPAEYATARLMVHLARQLLAESNALAAEGKLIDFNDMIYAPVLLGLRFPQYDVVMVDEAQDTNLVQRAILHRLVRAPGGRLVAVGDSMQAIYAWRGADSDAMAAIRDEFGCRELPLSVCYRCPRSVVELAQGIVPWIEPAPGAPLGAVEEWGELTPAALRALRPEDAVLCRNVAPLVRLSFALLAQGIGSTIMGRDIAAGVTALIRRSPAETLDDLLAWLEEYHLHEERRLLRRDEPERLAALEDRIAVIRAVAENLPAWQRTVPGLIQHIEGLFDEGSGRRLLTLSTIHRAKGLEWPRVVLLDRHLIPSRWARQDWQQAGERNLLYVAYTRARERLVFADSPRRERAE